MKIYALVKQVPDTAAVIRLAGPAAVDPGQKFIANPYDEFAVEEALRFRDRLANGSEVVMVGMGPDAAKEALRSGLAMGADRALLVRTEGPAPDAIRTAHALAGAIAADGPAGIIFTGLHAIDTETMQVPFRVAFRLGVPVLGGIMKFESTGGGTATVHRDIEGGDQEIWEIPLPCVLAVARGINTPRYPKLPDIMKAKKKEIPVVEAASLLTDAPAARTEILKLDLPPDKPPARILEGDPAAAVAELVRLLRDEAKVL